MNGHPGPELVVEGSGTLDVGKDHRYLRYLHPHTAMYRTVIGHRIPNLYVDAQGGLLVQLRHNGCNNIVQYQDEPR